jgi:Flp pilus assembly CpaE family ATPase
VSVSVLIAAGGAVWESDLVSAWDRGAPAVSVARRCVDVVELLAVAASGQGRAALVSGSLRHLDADAVDRLLAAGVVPVAMVGRGDSETEQRLRAMGIDYLVPADADPEVIAAVVLEAATDRSGGDVHQPTRRFGDPATSMSIPPSGGGSVSEPMSGRRGSVIAVWGPAGAPGRTTVAVNVADELARLGAPTLLVDADVYGAAVGAVLGLLEESPGLAAACRQAAASRLDAAALAALSWQLAPQLRVLTGIPLASRWPELRPAAVESVLAAARGLAEFTIVDCGFCLETDEELSFDTLAPRRNAATLTVLDHADVLLVVGAADPVGMQRLIRALAELRDTEIAGPAWIVLNRVRRGVVPGDPAAELTAALHRFAGREPAALLAYDQDALDAALVTGRSLAEARPNCTLRAQLAELAASLAGVRQPPVRRRRRGSPAPGTAGLGRG